ncbi:MAG: hypothetical protein A4E48_02746 [Methanosaeta sp. PtaU1.Bin060]|nr:MAG: hypothetical protein A4E48_02746 [Methanosaeta sp. PtaU1.Bin060]
MEILDQYEIRARISPSVVVSLPLAVTLFIGAYEVSNSLTDTVLGAGVIYTILIYGISIFIRGFGHKIEQALWKSWGGPSSVRVMRWSDSLFGDEQKLQFHDAVRDKCSIVLSTRDEEKRSPKDADWKISQAFLQVRAILRRCDKEGLWSKHNAEYGFQRNLLGSRVIWLLFSILGSIGCWTSWTYEKANIWILGLAINLLWAIASIICGWYLLPKFIRFSADRYAESAWSSFLICAQKDPA